MGQSVSPAHSALAGNASHANHGPGTLSANTSRAGGPQGRTLPGRSTTGLPKETPADARLSASAGVQIRGPVSPRDLLLGYQRKWADDESRFKFGLWSRQTGKDFSSGEEGIRDCFRKELDGDKTTWLIGAAGERQALESMEKWKEWAQAYSLSIADIIEEREGGHEALLKSSQIVFPGGSRVISVPANPNTVRGFSANILLTEFAFIEDPDATWRAIAPSITNPLRGGLKKIRIITTPNGVGNKAHDLWVKNHGVEGAKWSTHKITIHDAIAQGLPVDAEELRAMLDDPEGWAQEYLCEFMDTASVLLPYDLIALCEALEATAVIDPSYWTAKSPWPLYTGIDFGRKKDLTVAWSSEGVSDLLITKSVIEMQNVPTPSQIDRLRHVITKSHRVCLDYTGPGIGMGDYLVKEFGEWNPTADKFGKIELVTMSGPVKQDLFSKLKMSFEARRQRIPVSRVIREDLHSVHRIVTQTGNVSYRAAHTEDGHADRCTALALCTRAASFQRGSFVYRPVSVRGRNRIAAQKGVLV